MDDYIKSLIDKTAKSYFDYKIAMKEYLTTSYIDEAGELVYPVAIAARANDKKEEFEEAYRNLQIARSIINYESN